jgi:membrane-bound lytic murein transglycosylase F
MAAIMAAIYVMTAFVSCGTGNASHQSDTDSSNIYRLPDTLRVATLYSPTSYFLFRDEQMGYDYNLANDFAKAKGIVLDLKVATSLNAMIDMLDSGVVDLLAYEIPVTSEYRERVLPCGTETYTTQVLVQPRRKANERITDVTQLIGRDVYVEKGSKYQYRMENINDNLGGGINIHAVDRDTLITEDLIAMVSQGEIPLTVVDSDIARINKTYYPDLDITLPVSFTQRASWGVSPKKPWLADSINAWFAMEEPKKENAILLKRYFELSKHMPPSAMNIDLSKGRISPFDNIFRKHGNNSGIDWRLLASQGYVESRFDSTVVSWAGARGVMQLMPRTAATFGLTGDRIANTDDNIRVAAEVLKALDKSFAKDVPDKEERQKFVIAAYNSGIAHIRDAISLAKKYGKNPAIWSGNVEDALLMKAKPEFFNDPVCKYGYFRGKETVRYVKDVMSLYERCKKDISS